MTRYALIAVLGLLAAAVAALWVQSGNVTMLRDENAALRLTLSAVRAQNENIKEDQKSDATIDDMPDLRVVPDRWLFPGPGSGGLY